MTDDIELEDKILLCSDCGEKFIFYKGEQVFYKEREEELKQKDPKKKFKEPKRCRVCRKTNRNKREEFINVQQREKERVQGNGDKWQKDLANIKFDQTNIVEFVSLTIITITTQTSKSGQQKT